VGELGTPQVQQPSRSSPWSNSRRAGKATDSLPVMAAFIAPDRGPLGESPPGSSRNGSMGCNQNLVVAEVGVVGPDAEATGHFQPLGQRSASFGRRGRFAPVVGNAHGLLFLQLADGHIPPRRPASFTSEPRPSRSVGEMIRLIPQSSMTRSSRRGLSHGLGGVEPEGVGPDDGAVVPHEDPGRLARNASGPSRG